MQPFFAVISRWSSFGGLGITVRLHVFVPSTSYALWTNSCASFLQKSNYVHVNPPKDFIVMNAFTSVIAMINESTRNVQFVVRQGSLSESPCFVPQACILLLWKSTAPQKSKWLAIISLYLKLDLSPLSPARMLSFCPFFTCKDPYVLIKDMTYPSFFIQKRSKCSPSNTPGNLIVVPTGLSTKCSAIPSSSICFGQYRLVLINADAKTPHFCNPMMACNTHKPESKMTTFPVLKLPSYKRNNKLVVFPTTS